MRRLALALLLLGCDRPPPPKVPGIGYIDARGKTVRLPAPPRRIISLAPSTTELLFAVGAGDLVAGVTTYCDWPPEARSKPKVGNIVLDQERIAAIHPDLVLTAGTITRNSTDSLEARGVPVFAIDPGSFEEIQMNLRTLGMLVDRERQAGAAADALQARVRALPPPTEHPTFYFEHSADPLGTTGPDTYIGRCLALAGGKNIFEGAWLNRIDWESVLARDPEVILIAHERTEGLENRAGWKELRAVKAKRVHVVAKEHYVYPTPRLADGLEEAARLFREAKK